MSRLFSETSLLVFIFVIFSFSMLVVWISYFSWKRTKQNRLKSTRMVVLGAGVSELTCAAFLAQKGFKVTMIVEEESTLGGTSSTTTMDGYTFSNGANFIKFPALLDKVFEQLSSKPIPNTRITHPLKVISGTSTVEFGANGKVDIFKNNILDQSKSLLATEELSITLNKWLPVAKQMGKAMRESAMIDNVLGQFWTSFRNLFPFSSHSLEDELNQSFTVPEMKAAWLSTSLCKGRSVSQLPATAMLDNVCLLHDQLGWEAPKGGIQRVTTQLVKLCSQAGVRMLTDCRVLPGGINIHPTEARVTGVQLVHTTSQVHLEESTTETIHADAVIGTTFGSIGEVEVNFIKSNQIPPSLQDHKQPSSRSLFPQIFRVQLGLKRKLTHSHIIR